MSSSDLERAREMSRRLAAGSSGRPDAPSPSRRAGIGVAAPDPAGFVRLRRPAPRSTAASAPPVAADRPLRVAAFGGEGWDAILDWTLEATGAGAAFLMDPHGLVVACRGPLPSGQAEGLGARLMLALDQAAKMVPPGEESADLSVAVQFGEVLLTGFLAPLADGTVLTAGLISRCPIGASARQAVVGVLGAS